MPIPPAKNMVYNESLCAEAAHYNLYSLCPILVKEGKTMYLSFDIVTDSHISLLPHLPVSQRQLTPT